jgi:hypothetical protein
VAVVEQGFVVDAAAPHLGGNIVWGDPRTFAPTAWTYVIERLGIQSVMDLGSGMGHASSYFHRKGLKVIAVEGLPANVESAIHPTILHDITVSPVQARVDLVHCQEVVEHIEERFLDNLIGSMLCGRYILMTNAIPGQGGHHHVNEQPIEYWVNHMAKRGCQPLVADTQRLRQLAAQDGAVYLAQTGTLYANMNRV